MPSHEQKQCPRCSSLFECKSGSVLLCQCQTVYLASEHLDFINRHYTDCLCAACLKAVRTEFDNRKLRDKPRLVVWNKELEAEAG